MPLVNLPDRLAADFALLTTLAAAGEKGMAFFKQFTKLAHQSVLTGTDAEAAVDSKMFGAAAGKIGGDATAASVRGAVLGLAHVLVQCAKAGLRFSKNDFMLSTAAVGLPRGQAAYLCDHFFLHASDYRKHLKQTHNASIPRYSDLNWRLDVEVASRTRTKAVTPSFVVQLNTVSGSMGNTKQKMLMTADYANMQHMRTELAAAVASMKTTRAMRVTRYLQ